MQGNVCSSEPQPQDAVLLLTLRHWYDIGEAPTTELGSADGPCLEGPACSSDNTDDTHILLSLPPEAFPDDDNFRYGRAHLARTQ